AFGSQEKSFVLAVPRPIAAKAQSTIVIFRKFQGTGRRALLGGDEIKHPVTGRRTTDVVKGDLPGFVQSNPGFRRGQIDETMAHLSRLPSRATCTPAGGLGSSSGAISR